jgi:hypothetical protein
MTKITLNNLANLQNENTAVTTINNNNDTIETISDSFLSRDGTAPNQMEALLDMNSNRIINLPAPITGDEPLRLQDLEDLLEGSGTIPPAGTLLPIMDGTATVGTSGRWAHEDHIHPTDTTRAPLASPALTGTPTAPTASAGTNTTQLATTAFVNSSINNVTNKGCVCMWPKANQDSGPWNVIDGYGNPINTTGTTTQGLQEAINYAVYNGQPLRVYGGGPHQLYLGLGNTHSNTTIDGLTSTAGFLPGDAVTGAGIPAFSHIVTVNSPTSITINNAATATATVGIRVERPAGANLNNFIACSTGITVPPAEQWDADFRDVNITIVVANSPGITFDSCMMVTWRHTGQVVYIPTAPDSNSFAVLWAPRNPVPVDGITGVTGSHFYISQVASPASSGFAAGCWGFNLSQGGIDTSFFYSCELNGTGIGTTSNTHFGIYAFSPGTGISFQQNIFDITNIHLVDTAGIQIGNNTTNAANLHGNVWRIGGINPGGASCQGINTFGSYDIFEVGQLTNQQGTLVNGLVTQSTAVKNIFNVGQILCSGPPVLNGNPSGLNTYNYDASRVPKITVYTSGSGTHTMQAWTKSARIRILGGGAGGSGGGTTPGNGGPGGNTTFGSMTANGGTINAGAGGSASGGNINIQGGAGGAGLLVGTNGIGGPGGSAAFFGTSSFGVVNGTPTPPGANSGSGGGGGGSNTSTNPGAGGSAGGYSELNIVSGLAASYSYSVGAGGSAGTAGTNGQAGAVGAAGFIEVVEYP